MRVRHAARHENDYFPLIFPHQPSLMTTLEMREKHPIVTMHRISGLQQSCRCPFSMPHHCDDLMLCKRPDDSPHAAFAYIAR